MTTHLGPVLAAARQRLHDAIAAYLTEVGDRHPDGHAERIVQLAWDADWRPPHPASEEPVPPLLPDRQADPDHRAACMDEIRAALSRPRDTLARVAPR